MSVNKKSLIVGTVVASIMLMGASSCVKEDSQSQGRKTQEEIMKRAQQSVPVPQVENFRTRKAVAEWMERMDTPDKVFYIYLLGNNGQKIGYYIGQTRPISVCSFMTPTEREIGVGGSGANPLGQAPALDGVWYGGGGCDQYFFFDAETDALHSIGGINYLVSDQPLEVDVEPLSVTTIEDVQ